MSLGVWRQPARWALIYGRPSQTWGDLAAIGLGDRAERTESGMDQGRGELLTLFTPQV
jgi:hypothetical protein